MKPPPVLDSARVLEYAVVDASVVFTGKLHLYSGDKRIGAVPHLAICRDPRTSDLILFHCDADWNVVAAQIWNAPGVAKPASVQEIKARAEKYYSGLASRWTAHD